MIKLFMHFVMNSICIDEFSWLPMQYIRYGYAVPNVGHIAYRKMSLG